jgi:hypothetical protein
MAGGLPAPVVDCNAPRLSRPPVAASGGDTLRIQQDKLVSPRGEPSGNRTLGATLVDGSNPAPTRFTFWLGLRCSSRRHCCRRIHCQRPQTATTWKKAAAPCKSATRGRVATTWQHPSRIDEHAVRTLPDGCWNRRGAVAWLVARAGRDVHVSRPFPACGTGIDRHKPNRMAEPISPFVEPLRWTISAPGARGPRQHYAGRFQGHGAAGGSVGWRSTGRTRGWDANEIPADK